MSKAGSLFRVMLSEGMNPFRISGKKQNGLKRIGIPVIVAIWVMMAMAMYGLSMMEPLAESNMEYVTLTVFALFSALFVLGEGLYKASGLLFNCRDDDLVLSLPIKKSTVLLLRVVKFYLFEVLVNALFLAPVMIVYALKVGVSASFYVVAIVALFALPVLPVVLASLIGGLISYFSSKFRFKNLAQIVLTIAILMAALIAWFNFSDVMTAFVQNAGSINDVISKFYYPAGQFINLVLDFNIWQFLIFIVTNMGLLIVMVILLGRVYFKINSRVKVVKLDGKKRDYVVKSKNVTWALMKKEIGRFVNSPVFLINAGFGLVIYVVVCVVLSINMDTILGKVAEMGFEGLTAEAVLGFVPAVVFGLIFITSMLSSITSSMISLEGKSFNILKSLPVTTMRILLAKVFAAMLVMVPMIIIGDIVVFVRFRFDVWQTLMIIVASVLVPMLAEVVGIIINLKFPKMDAKDDVEVVKQSLSSFVAVFVGMIASGVMMYAIYAMYVNKFSASEAMLIWLMTTIIILGFLLLYLRRRGVKEFNAINV